MPLKVVEITDLRNFTRNFINLQGPRTVDPNNNNFSEGNNLGNADGTSTGSQFQNGCYFHNADLYSFRQGSPKNSSVTGLRTLYPFFYGIDALCRDHRKGWYYPLQYQPTAGSGSGTSYHFGDGSVLQRLVPGQPNLQTGQQSFYRYGAISGAPSSAPETYVAGWHRFNCRDAARQNFFENYWPNISSDFNGVNGGAADGNTAGYWVADGGVNGNQDEYHALVFEGITSTVGGMPGETSASAGMLRAVTSHPKGLLLIRARSSNFLGNGTANNLGTRWVWVDVTTGLAVGVLGTPTLANTFSTNVFHDESVDHKTFDWQNIQFVPDEGSSYNRPKGELHLMHSEDQRFQLPNRTIQVGEETPFSATVIRGFVKVIDFNPFNEVGGAVRIHNRRRFIGMLEIPVGPIQAGGQTCPVSGTTNDRRSPEFFYHPSSRTYINIQSRWADPDNDGANEPVAGSSRIIRFARQTVIADITAPVPDAPIRAESLITLRVKVVDDFGTPVAGATINFRSNRRSTRDEQFNGTTQGSSNYTVVRGLIDNDASLQVYSGGSVDTGGTLLIPGVDYTVSNYATGILAPVGSWPAATISVRYRHRAAPVYPGFGSLITTSAVTDAFGVATVVTELGAQLQGELTGLEASDEAFI